MLALCEALAACTGSDRHSSAKHVHPNPLSQVGDEEQGHLPQVPQDAELAVVCRPSRSYNPRADKGGGEEGVESDDRSSATVTS